MITIKFDDRAVLDALTRRQSRTSDLSPLMHDIGEHLTETTKRTGRGFLALAARRVNAWRISWSSS